MSLYPCVIICSLIVVQVACQQGNKDVPSSQTGSQPPPAGSGGYPQNQQDQQGNNPLGNWPFMNQGQGQQFNPTGGIQAMFNPMLHAGAAISHTALELGKGFLRWPLGAMGDIQTGITGFFNAFANPIWVAPTRRPYDQTLGELLSQLPQQPPASTTQQPTTTSTKRPTQNQNPNQNRPTNQG